MVISGGDFDASKVEGKRAAFGRKMVHAATWAESELGKSHPDNVGMLMGNGDLKPIPYEGIYEGIVGLDAEKVNGALKGYAEGKAVVKLQLRLI